MKARLISILLLLFTSSFIAQSQDIYLLKYRSPDVNDKTTYDAFFSLSANGTGIVRVKPVGNNNLTAEMTFQEQYATDNDGMPDTTKLVYQGMEPVIVKGDKNSKFSPVTFWFKINKSNFFDPWTVTDVSGKPASSGNNLISAEFIKNQDLGKFREVVSIFFADTSMYYKNLFGSRSKGGMLSPEEKKNTHLYMVVVASTNDQTLQPYCSNDARKVINMFSEIANNVLGLLPRNIHIDTIFGNNYSRANVEMALKRLPASNASNNMFIFYYSGHGYHDKNKPEKIFPSFDLRDPRKKPFIYKDVLAQAADLEANSLNVQDIYNIILAKGARFNLVLSDCCNDTVAAPKKKGFQPPGHKGLTKANFENVKTLFMNKQPVKLLMTAASKDERAVITPSFNSYFTYFFLQSLATYISPEKGFPSWLQVQAAAQSQTIRQVSGLSCEEKTNCPKQTPKALIPGIR